MFVQNLRNQLTEAKNAILGRSRHRYGLDESSRDATAELSTVDNHPADVASELFEREKDLGLELADKQQLDAIDHAIARMDDGTYGTCERCGTAIPEERLDAMPSTTLCISCRQEIEHLHHDLKRPVEEEVLAPGRGVSFDSRMSEQWDVEDAYQVVARFNERTPDDKIYEEVHASEDEGIVDDLDKISNEQYQAQLPESPNSH